MNKIVSGMVCTTSLLLSTGCGHTLHGRFFTDTIKLQSISNIDHILCNSNNHKTVYPINGIDYIINGGSPEDVRLIELLLKSYDRSIFSKTKLEIRVVKNFNGNRLGYTTRGVMQILQGINAEVFHHEMSHVIDFNNNGFNNKTMHGIINDINNRYMSNRDFLYVNEYSTLSVNEDLATIHQKLFWNHKDLIPILQKNKGLVEKLEAYTGSLVDLNALRNGILLFSKTLTNNEYRKRYHLDNNTELQFGLLPQRKIFDRYFFNNMLSTQIRCN